MKKLRVFFLVLLAAVFCLGPFNKANGQEIRAEFKPQVEFMVWPTVERNYQHEYRAGVDGQISWRNIEFDSYVNGIFWQTNTSKVPGSPFNAENNMNNMVKYGGTLKLKKSGFFVGPTIHRTEIHVVWRFKERNGYLDGWGGPATTWRGEERACRSGVGCASIAYQDAWGVSAGYEDENVDVEARWLFRRWKTLTLAPRPLRFNVKVNTWENWQVEAAAWQDLKNRWRGDLSVQRRVHKKLWVGARFGRLQPDHKRAFTRLGLGVVVR
jgi:hypothetical protein